MEPGANWCAPVLRQAILCKIILGNEQAEKSLPFNFIFTICPVQPIKWTLNDISI